MKRNVTFNEIVDIAFAVFVFLFTQVTSRYANLDFHIEFGLFLVMKIDR